MSILGNILNWECCRRTLRRWRRRWPGKDRIRLQPAGAYATNLLGLSEQVPAKVVFLTDGPSRTVKIGRQEIQLRRTTPRNMAAAGRLSGLLMQALRASGQRAHHSGAGGAFETYAAPEGAAAVVEGFAAGSRVDASAVSGTGRRMICETGISSNAPRRSRR